MEVAGVGQGHQGVPAAGDDLHWRVDRGKELAEALELFGVAPQVAGRLREAVTRVGLDVVLDYISGRRREPMVVIVAVTTSRRLRQRARSRLGASISSFRAPPTTSG
jgi:hypothetical protein